MEKSTGYTALPVQIVRHKPQTKNKLVVGFVVLASVLNVAYSWFGNHPFSKVVTETPSVQDDEFSWSQVSQKPR